MSRRTERLGELIRAEVSELLRRRVNDPRLASMLTVTQVKVAADLSQAQVYVSVMGSDEEKAAAMAALHAASGFLRRELAGRLAIRRLPTLTFRYDETMEQASRLFSILHDLDSHEVASGED